MTPDPDITDPDIRLFFQAAPRQALMEMVANLAVQVKRLEELVRKLTPGKAWTYDDKTGEWVEVK